MCFPYFPHPLDPSHLTLYISSTLLHLSIHPTSSVLQISNIYYLLDGMCPLFVQPKTPSHDFFVQLVLLLPNANINNFIVFSDFQVTFYGASTLLCTVFINTCKLSIMLFIFMLPCRIK